MKRLIDCVVAAAVLVLLAPVILLVAIGIVIAMGTPVFFVQERPGMAGIPFRMVKFRTMRGTTDRLGIPLPDELRLTRFGRFLRRTSLDELPELWNVLRGEMSLVGPRPLLMDYLGHYTPEQMRRHDVRPGITGWAQVNGRNAITWEEKFVLDVWYVDHRSLWLDIRILAMTVGKVMRREGISSDGVETAVRFDLHQEQHA